MDILPAWLIEELKKMEEEKRSKRENRLYIDIPIAYEEELKEDEDETAQATIPLR